MFNSLREKLKLFTRNLETELDESTETQKTAAGISDKAKAAILDQEIIISEKHLEKPLLELEMALLESDVALSVAEYIIESVKKELIGTRKKLGAHIGDVVEDVLRTALLHTISVQDLDFDQLIRDADKPVNIMFVGVNGTGKTTCIAKLAHMLKENGYSVVMAAGDTYRAGAEEQIDKHASNLKIKLIKHQRGADPTAVVYDAVQYASAHKIDVVLADTAGRFHTNINLMEQLKKIQRITSPDLVIFVDEATAGNDAVERATQFNEEIGIDGSILTKIDADVKGGAAVSIAHSTGKPVLFIGTGQQYTDLEKFDPTWLVDRLIG